MHLSRIVTTWIFVALCVSLYANGALAQVHKSDIASITAENISGWFVNPVLDKDVIAPGYRRVRSQGKLVGAVFLTDQINPIPAYSGTPVSVLAAIDGNGRIVGVKIHHHQEPILVIGVKSADLDRFTQQFVGLRAADPIRVGDTRANNAVDGLTGATITTMVITRSISTSAKVVYASLRATDGRALEHEAPSAELEDTLLRWDSWAARKGAVAVMSTALIVLLSILFFQDWLVRRPVIYRYVRLGYLLFTVSVIGFVFAAQLSVINLFAFIQNISRGFSWSTLLIDPIIFLLWAFVAISLLLWGRGVFCGWLCPFGALQELIHKAARQLELPSFTLPPLIHERLWALKYFMLIALLGVSLESFETMATLAEIEPFKTFALSFDRPWYYGIYAAALLLAAVFNGKFYCKYLCVLGAGLSILGRLRIFDWLHRRNQCGNPCQSCAHLCPNGAIKETGEIISHECHYCLDCQVAYWDQHFCQALLPQRHKQRANKNPPESEIQIIAIERKTP